MLGRIAVSAFSATRERASSVRGSVWLIPQHLSTDAESHDDFKPKYTAPAATGGVEEHIKHAITSDKVHVFMKGTPTQPQCGFSRMTCVVLQAYGVPFGATNVLTDPEIREGIKKFTSWPTIPQVFVNGEFVGGCDILMSMHDSGDLEKLLAPIREGHKEGAAK